MVTFRVYELYPLNEPCKVFIMIKLTDCSARGYSNILQLNLPSHPEDYILDLLHNNFHPIPDSFLKVFKRIDLHQNPICVEWISFKNVFCLDPTGNSGHIPTPPDSDTTGGMNVEEEESQPPSVVVSGIMFFFCVKGYKKTSE